MFFCVELMKLESDSALFQIWQFCDGSTRPRRSKRRGELLELTSADELRTFHRLGIQPGSIWRVEESGGKITAIKLGCVRCRLRPKTSRST
jgi:hypothetical protein